MPCAKARLPERGQDDHAGIPNSIPQQGWLEAQPRKVGPAKSEENYRTYISLKGGAETANRSSETSEGARSAIDRIA